MLKSPGPWQLRCSRIKLCCHKVEFTDAKLVRLRRVRSGDVEVGRQRNRERDGRNWAGIRNDGDIGKRRLGQIRLDEVVSVVSDIVIDSSSASQRSGSLTGDIPGEPKTRAEAEIAGILENWTLRGCGIGERVSNRISVRWGLPRWEPWQTHNAFPNSESTDGSSGSHPAHKTPP